MPKTETCSTFHRMSETRHYNFADLFELAADTVPDRIALIDKRREINYRDLDERATRFGNALLDAGVKAGDHVGILATNCIEWVEAMYGIYKVRARVVNVNFRYVEEELRYLFENSDLVALVYQREYGPLVAASRDAQPALQHFYRIEWDDPNFLISTLCCQQHPPAVVECVGFECASYRVDDSGSATITQPPGPPLPK